jgi:hypothetical protein
MAALARARQEWPPHPRWHKGAGTHGTAPDCDWGFTGEDCDTPICGVETFQDPKSPYGDLREEKECAPMPSALARKSFPVRMARLGWDLGLYPLPGAPPHRLRQRSHPLATQASRPAPCRRRGHDLPEPQQDLPAWRRPPALRLPRPDQGECAAPLHVPAPPPLAPDGVRCGASPTVHAEAADPLLPADRRRLRGKQPGVAPGRVQRTCQSETTAAPTRWARPPRLAALSGRYACRLVRAEIRRVLRSGSLLWPPDE